MSKFFNKIFFLTIILALIVAESSIAQSTRWKLKVDSADIFSSPRFSDLNADGIKDIVLGAGIEYVASNNGIIAINGKNGELLWTVATESQIYTSALFQDINADGTADVFIGGRAAYFSAIDGKTGQVIWRFWENHDENPEEVGFSNFYATQWVDDQNKDGFKDLLVANGGAYKAGPQDKNRPTAQLMILSGKTGEIIAQAKLPEERESYYAPHTFKNKKGIEMILFGTGGETIDGGLWKVPLKSLRKKDISKSEMITHDSVNGFILNSVLTDLNNDGVLDVVNARMNATLSAFDGVTNKVLWENTFKGYECYVTPTLGQFTGDKTPDFFTIIAKGYFPNYESFKLIIIDGKTGEIAWENKSGFNQFSPAIAADLNNDGTDEVIYIENTLLNPSTFQIVNQLKVIDIKNNSNYFIGNIRTGMSMASSPAIVDLDNDGLYEIIVVSSSLSKKDTKQYSRIECVDLNKNIQQITWPGYLGGRENGILLKK